MGKAAKWFRALLGIKKSDPQSSPTRTDSKPAKEKRRWSFVKSYREKDQHHHATRPSTGDRRKGGSYGESTPVPPPMEYVDGVDPNKRAIAVAAATASAAEKAVAAAQAAAAVVRLTSSGRSTVNSVAYVSASCGVPEDWAAVKIQASFRGYLARRALRALKGLVKLQSLVRGHIERKKHADKMRSMQALLRAQARARAMRALVSESSQSSSKSSLHHHPGPATPEKFEHVIRAKSARHDQSSMLKRNSSKSKSKVILDQEKAHSGNWNWLEHRMDEVLSDQRGPPTRTVLMDDEKSDKILEIDTGKPHFTPKRKNLLNSSHHALSSDQNSHSFTTSKDSATHQTLPSPSSCEVQSLSPLKFSHGEVDEASFCTADNSPQFYSASSRGGSSRRGPFTPTKSDGSRSYLSGYSDHPNYMAYTESSKAKLRSLSAPKQRPFERSGSAKRNSVHGLGAESRSSAQKGIYTNFTNKAYPGSGRLDRLGMPMRGEAVVNSGMVYNRY